VLIVRVVVSLIRVVLFIDIKKLTQPKFAGTSLCNQASFALLAPRSTSKLPVQPYRTQSASHHVPDFLVVLHICNLWYSLEAVQEQVSQRGRQLTFVSFEQEVAPSLKVANLNSPSSSQSIFAPVCFITLRESSWPIPARCDTVCSLPPSAGQRLEVSSIYNFLRICG
jgi:hypothetical protein